MDCNINAQDDLCSVSSHDQHLLAWVECHHAKLEMGLLSDPPKVISQVTIFTVLLVNL